MYYATLIFKNGNKLTVTIPKMVQFIDVPAANLTMTSGAEEFVDLTPGNIIDKGGFSNVTESKSHKIRFELCGNHPGFGTDDRNLDYKEI